MKRTQTNFKTLTISAIAATSLLLSACAPQGSAQRSQQTGSILGGIVGGFFGSQIGEGSGKTVASIVGALAGAWAGSQIAQNLTRQDRVYYDEAATQSRAADVGETVTWYNPESGNSGTITATREGESNGGEYCREYQQTVTIDGQTERAFGTACQEPDGSWRIVN